MSRPPSDWAETRAPSLAAIEALADAAFGVLPDAFRRLCADVRILPGNRR